jgi:hypothetical protein
MAWRNRHGHRHIELLCAWKLDAFRADVGTLIRRQQTKIFEGIERTHCCSNCATPMHEGPFTGRRCCGL